jgi:hypothetical protein
LAASNAYAPEVLAAVAAAGNSRQPSVSIGDAYLAAMHATAVRQIALAGRRTAAVLAALADVAASSGCARQVKYGAR